jgi:hypothetical protein
VNGPEVTTRTARCRTRRLLGEVSPRTREMSCLHCADPRGCWGDVPLHHLTARWAIYEAENRSR